MDRFLLSPGTNHEVDLERLEGALRDGYDLVVLVNPNIPTGRHIPRHALEKALRGVPPGNACLGG